MGRIARGLGLDRNPLRRRSDRIGRWTTLAMALVVLVTGPLLVWRTGKAAYRSTAAAVARDRQQQRFAVDAVLQQDAVITDAADGRTVWQPDPVPARWTAPDGTARTGPVRPDTGGPAGSVVVIWTDRHGDLVAPPTRRDPVVTAIAAGMATAGITGGAVGLLALLVRRRRHRRRMADWQFEWMLVEPRWSGRR